MRKIRLSFIVFIAIAILTPLLTCAQYEGKARMQGVVKDGQGKPLAGVTVKLYSFRAHAGFETKTDKNGIWKAIWVRSGKWNIDFDKKGYEPKKISTTLKASSIIDNIEITMNRLKGLVLKEELMKDFEKGNKLFSEKKWDDALKIYSAILEKFPDSYVINLNLGNCHFEKQEYEEAIQAYKKVVENEPDNTDALISIGNSYSNMKQNDKALEWYKKIEVSKIDDPVVLYNIGVFNFNAGDMKSALQFFERSTKVKEDFLNGWYQLGMTYMGLGDNGLAVKSFETFLKHDQDSEKAQQVKEILKALKVTE